MSRFLTSCFLPIISLLLAATLTSCQTFSFRNAVVYEKPKVGGSFVLSRWQIDGAGFNPVFEKNIRNFMEHSLRREGIPLVSAPASNDSQASANNPDTGTPVLLTISLLVAKPDLIYGGGLADYSLVIEGSRFENASHKLLFTFTWLFKNPYNSADARLMNLFHNAVLDLKEKLFGVGRPKGILPKT